MVQSIILLSTVVLNLQLSHLIEQKDYSSDTYRLTKARLKYIYQLYFKYETSVYTLTPFSNSYSQPEKKSEPFWAFDLVRYEFVYVGCCSSGV